MKTNRTSKLIYAVLFFCLAGYLNALDISAPLEEIKQLYDAGKYSIALEKSLNILATKEDKLAPADAAALYFYVGASYKKDNNAEMAADYLKKIEKKFPTSDYVKKAAVELVDIFKNDYFQKAAYLEKIFEKFPNTPEALDAGIELAKENIRIRNFRKALPVLETIIKLWKKGDEKPEVYMLSAVGYSGVENYVEASVYLQEAEKKMNAAIKGNAIYIYEAGKISYYTLNYKKAIEYLEQLFNVFTNYPNIPEAAILLANAHEKEGNPSLSAIFLMRAIRKKPENKSLYTLYLNLGRILSSMDPESIDKLKQNYPLIGTPEKLLTTVKNESMNPEERKMAAILLSEDYKKNNKMVKSIDTFFKYLVDNRDPMVEKLFKENLDTYLYDLEKKKNYEGMFETWLKLKSRKSYLSADNLLKFGDIFFKMKMYANAEEIFQHILKYKLYSGKWSEAASRMIRLSFLLGKYRDCLDLINKFEPEGEPDISEFNFYKIVSLRDLKKDEEANNLTELLAAQLTTVSNSFQFQILIERLQKLVKENKIDDALALCVLMEGFKGASPSDKALLLIKTADLYYKKNEPDKALGLYFKAIQPNSGASNIDKEWALFQVTSIYKEKGNTREANNSLAQLKKLNPNSFWVRQLEKNVR